MADGAIAWVKEHPYASAGIGVAVVIVVLVFMSSGSSSASGNTSDAAALAAAQAQEAASGNALQQTQAELAAATNQANAGVTANGQNDAVEQMIAQLEASTTQNANQTSAESADTIAGLQATASEVQSTAAVTVNANNDTSAVTQALYEGISSTVQNNPTGGVISGAYDVNTGSFSVNAQPTQTGTGGFADFLKDPLGNVYELEEDFNSNSVYPAGTLTVGVAPNGANVFYKPITPISNATTSGQSGSSSTLPKVSAPA